jgi:hypothetical protein
VFSREGVWSAKKFKTMDETELKQLFTEQGYELDFAGCPDLLERVNNMLSAYKLSSSELLNEWEAYCLQGQTTKLDSTGIVALETRFKEEAMKKKQAKQMRSSGPAVVSRDEDVVMLHQTPARPNRPPLLEASNSGVSNSSAKREKFTEMFNVKMEPLEMTPMRKPQLSMTTPQREQVFNSRSFLFTPSPAVKASPASEPFLGRANKGQVRVVLNDHLPLCHRNTPESSKTQLSVEHLPHEPQYQLNLSDEADLWKQQSSRVQGIISQMVEVAQSYAKQDEIVHLENMVQPQQAEVYMAGIICTPDTLQTSFEKRMFDRKLDNLTVFLEVWDGQGECIQLNLESVGNFSLFPGQAVLVKGTNPDGRQFHVTSMLTVTTILICLYVYNFTLGCFANKRY